MKKIRVFLIDSSLRYLEWVTEYLSGARDIEIAGHAVDAAKAMHLIARTQPDCIVTGLALRSFYGLSFLRSLSAIPSRPALIVCTFFSSDTAVFMSKDIGADMFLIKPVSPSHLHECIVGTTLAKRRMLEQVRALTASSPVASATARIHRALVDAGVSPRLDGFACLSQALFMLMENERLLSNLRRNLYPSVGRLLDKTPESVERNIRTAIIRAHAGEGEAQLCRTNHRFLADMLKKLRDSDF